ncbi:MAG: DUF928 domain-containing protein [Cyanobacteria bacterium J06648_16]
MAGLMQPSAAIAEMPAQREASAAVALSSPPSSQIRWRPNPDRGTASSTLSGGRRGAIATRCAADGPSLALLVPNQSESLLTTAVQPTVAWYVETERTVQMDLLLSHPDQAMPVYSKTLTADQTGMLQVTLPELESDIRYRWTVFLRCDRTTAEVYSRSFIERVTASHLAMPTHASGIERAGIYANAGIWYDACDTLLTHYQQTQQPELLAALHRLLSQASPDHPLLAEAR